MPVTFGKPTPGGQTTLNATITWDMMQVLEEPIEMAEKRDLLSIADLSAAENRRIIQRALEMKSDSSDKPLAGKSVALLFEKPSLRTRTSSP